MGTDSATIFFKMSNPCSFPCLSTLDYVCTILKENLHFKRNMLICYKKTFQSLAEKIARTETFFNSVAKLLTASSMYLQRNEIKSEGPGHDNCF